MAQVGSTEVERYLWMLSSPLVPYLHPLFEDVKMFLVCYRSYSCKEAFTSGLVFNLYSLLRMITASGRRTIFQPVEHQEKRW